MERGISDIMCVSSLHHFDASSSTFSQGQDEGVKVGDARRVFTVVREGRESGFKCYNRVCFPYATARTPVSLIPPRVLRQPGQPPIITETSGAAGQPQNALTITTPSRPTPTDPGLSRPGSLSITSLPARPNLPDDPIMP